jgi:ABC-2 type transport system permease protein
MPLVAFPSLFLAVNVGGLHRTTNLPGFPHVHGFLDYQLAAAMTQSLMLGGVSAGIATALEIENGFFDRLIAAPIPRVTIVLGRLLAMAVLAVLQVLWFVSLGLIFGAHIEGGFPGTLLVISIGALTGTGFAALGIMLALRAKNASLVQGIFPLAFVVLFLSSAFFPMGLLHAPASWVAKYNPLSYIADGMRNPIIAAISAKPVLDGLLAAGALTAVMMALCVQALWTRLREE